MSKKMYANLHTHTDYSNIRLLDSVNKVEPLLKYAGQLNMSGIAITDHECVSGWMKALNTTKKLKEEGVLPSSFKTILGNEIYLVNDREEAKQDRYYHAVLLAKNKKGNEQIRRLSSLAWYYMYNHRGMERVPTLYSEIDEVIGEEKGNVIFSTACLGSYFAQRVLDLIENPKEENKYPIHDFITWGINVFGKENFFIEIQPNPNSQEQLNYNKKAVEIAKAYGLQWVVTTDAHFLKEEDREIHKAYLNSQEGEREVDEFYQACYLMSYEEVKEKIKQSISEEDAEIALQNSNVILNMCEEYTLDHPMIVPEINIDNKALASKELYKYKEYEHIERFVNSENKYDRYLIVQLEKGFEEKGFNYTQERLERIDAELDILWTISEHIQAKLSKYFIVAQELIEIMWNEGDSLVGTGRGSTGGFYLTYLLDIHQVDSIENNMPHWRFMNKGRLDDYPDIDIDTQTSKRGQILEAVKDYFGYDKVLNIVTFGTEGSRSALITACRGLGYDNDIAQYLANMIPSQRGVNRTLYECFYGNEDEDIEPLKDFINEVKKYPRLKETSLYIEGIINKRSIHASGVYIFNEPYWKNNSLMRSASGQEVTCWNMDESDQAGGLKFDFLSIEALDVIRTAMDLLIEDGYIEPEDTLKETYNKYFHPDVLEYDDPKMWGKVSNNEILKLFQFDTPIGLQGVQKAKPKNLIELTTVNSLVRLMTDNTEQPIEKYLRHKANIGDWYKEMDSYGLTNEEKKILEKHLSYTYGVGATQEDVMQLCLDPKISNFSMQQANKMRKGIAKKKQKIIDEMKKLFFSEGEKAGTSKNLLQYVWDTQIQPQCGYSFCFIHAFEYALIALQEMNLASRFPIIYWNTACLSIDASADDPNDKKNGTTDYGKVATAISNMQKNNIKVTLPDINKADFGFKPDVKNNQIVFGLKGINSVGSDVVRTIISNRPYKSLQDFLDRMVLSKDSPIKNTQIIQLIKAGAFDELENKERRTIMAKYLQQTFEPKKKLTLSNVDGIEEAGIVSEDMYIYVRYYKFKNYITQNQFVYDLIKTDKNKKGYSDRLLKLDDIAYQFYQEHFSEENIVDFVDDTIVISEKGFIKEFNKKIEVLKEWIKKEDVLKSYNNYLYNQLWKKHASGTIPKWEMDSLCFYYTDHELNEANLENYDVVNYFDLPREPEAVDFYTRKGIKRPKFKIHRIAGTVLDKNRYKHTLTLLTKEGVVTVKYYEGQFNFYDRQISQKMQDGKKKVVEKSWFKRGNKLLVAGFRQRDQFKPRRYKDTIYTRTTVLIENTNPDGSLTLKTEREQADE